MVNKAILVGRLGKDPEKRATPGGKTVCRFTLATDTGFGDARKTDWHNVVCFDKQADFVSNYMRKGSLVYVEGRISYGSYEKDGVKRYTTDIIANTVQSLTSRSDGQSAGGNFDVAQYDSPVYGGNSYDSQPQQSAPQGGGFADDGISNEDIPF